ncbi:MAG TPA: hypothetical protein V6C81_03980 [Planktothrix sp.]|jgi:hypothetical protein
MSNNPLAALIASLKSLFGSKRAPDSATDVDNAAPVEEDPHASQRHNNSSYTRLQSLPPKSTEGPAFARQGHDQMYQASKGGADATKAPPKRTSSTFTKLQALSASGTGSAANEPLTKDGNLNSLLDELDS